MNLKWKKEIEGVLVFLFSFSLKNCPNLSLFIGFIYKKARSVKQGPKDSPHSQLFIGFVVYFTERPLLEKTKLLEHPWLVILFFFE